MSSISVIIPTLNEAGFIGQAVRSVRALQPREIIVVDGGSRDGTVALAAGADRVLETLPGRACQMNAGAQHATGANLLFLHADCILEAGALEEAERHLARPDVVAGCFRMRIAACGAFYRAIEAGAAARVRLAGLIYGDQGLFLRRADFVRLGGFPPLQFMEDLFFSCLLRRQGRLVVGRRHILVSARRWQKTGPVRQTLRNWWLTGLAGVGVHPDRLARFYD